MAILRQITSFDMPDGGIGYGVATGWGYSFPLATLATSTIVEFSQIAATNSPVITSLTDSNGNIHTLRKNERNTSGGSEFWSSAKENCPVIGKGWSGRVVSATSSPPFTITDDTLTQRGVTWTTDQWAGLPYLNHNTGDAGTVTANNTTGTFTVTGVSMLAGAGQMYSLGGYVKTALSGSGDYFGGVAMEWDGVAAASLVDMGAGVKSDGVQNNYTNGQTISPPTHALGSAQVTIVACALADVSLAGTPALGSGYSNAGAGAFLKWDQANNMARVEYKVIANPGTTGPTFGVIANDHYQAIYLALLDASSSPTLGQISKQFPRAMHRGSRGR